MSATDPTRDPNNVNADRARRRRVAADAVADAWNDAGPNKAYHWFFQRRLRREWPTLAKSVMELAAIAKEESQ